MRETVRFVLFGLALLALGLLLLLPLLFGTTPRVNSAPFVMRGALCQDEPKSIR